MSLFPMWADDTEKIIYALDYVTSEIRSFKRIINDKNNYRMDIGGYFDVIKEALYFWTGNTYVGRRKDKAVEEAFQTFFVELYDLLLSGRNCKILELRKMANSALYQGVVYRYLGHSADDLCDGKHKIVVSPEYNDIYVSWSKNTEINTVPSKLYGPQTLLTCEIKESFYGIDLEPFGVCKSNEREVVFPTIKELITDCIVIEEDDTED